MLLVQENVTPSSCASPPGELAGSSVQRRPFQCMVIALYRPPTAAYPTAQALLADTAVTLCRKLAVLPGRFGLGTRVQAVPFQCSARVCWPVPSLSSPVAPTAQALRDDVAATPEK